MASPRIRSPASGIPAPSRPRSGHSSGTATPSLLHEPSTSRSGAHTARSAAASLKGAVRHAAAAAAKSGPPRSPGVAVNTGATTPGRRNPHGSSGFAAFADHSSSASLLAGYDGFATTATSGASTPDVTRGRALPPSAIASPYAQRPPMPPKRDSAASSTASAAAAATSAASADSGGLKRWNSSTRIAPRPPVVSVVRPRGPSSATTPTGLASPASPTTADSLTPPPFTTAMSPLETRIPSPRASVASRQPSPYEPSQRAHAHGPTHARATSASPASHTAGGPRSALSRTAAATPSAAAAAAAAAAQATAAAAAASPSGTASKRRLTTSATTSSGAGHAPPSHRGHGHARQKSQAYDASTTAVSAALAVAPIRVGPSLSLLPSRKAYFEQLLTNAHSNAFDMREGLRQLRRAVLDGGIPAAAPTTPVSGTASNAALSASRATAAGCRSCTLRGQVWKLFLGVWRVSASEYIKLVERGPCAVSPKIANDVFRTLATDVAFRADVNDDLLTRVLNAFGWKMASIPPRRLVNLKFSYVQGMNVLAAPLLYVMPELDAFYTFVQFIQHTCPLYVQPALEGVHCGLKLLDRCLAILDPELHHYLKSKNLPVTLFAFPSVMTFSACTPPLSEVLQLWDLLLAYGVHLNIIAIVAQLHLIRDQILATPQPNRLLRQFPELRATAVTELTLTLLPRIPEDLYDLLVRHPFDPTVFDDILPDDDPALAELPSAVPPGLRPPSPPLAAM